MKLKEFLLISATILTIPTITKAQDSVVNAIKIIINTNTSDQTRFQDQEIYYIKSEKEVQDSLRQEIQILEAEVLGVIRGERFPNQSGQLSFEEETFLFIEGVPEIFIEGMDGGFYAISTIRHPAILPLKKRKMLLERMLIAYDFNR